VADISEEGKSMGEASRQEVEKLLSSMERVGASDMHLKAMSPPIYRVNGQARRIDAPPLEVETLTKMIHSLLDSEQEKCLQEEGSVDFGIGIPQVGRFRLNIFRQRGSLSLCARRVNTNVPTFESLYLPPSVERIPKLENGIVLVVGATGSGKSTTMAAIISQINSTRRKHILTIEDPIEFIYHDDKAFISQREVGIDAPEFHSALRFALRQDPDVILIGELRDRETIETALQAAETGHLVLATLHANDAPQVVGRVLDFFPGDRQNQVRQLLARTLRAVVAQKLVKGAKPDLPRIPAVEVMFGNAVIRQRIMDGEEHRLSEAIRHQSKEGMQDFNMSLYRLAKEGMISEETALEHSPNPEQLRMNFRGMTLNQDQGSL
jgi:twitching motility protein PilT